MIRLQQTPHGPTFNHTRSDGPFDPCPECLGRMSREQLIELARDLLALRRCDCGREKHGAQCPVCDNDE